MDSISLNALLPHVFMARTDLQSDIWRQEVRLERGKTYLVEANSGTGKSSLCSFLIGFRTDFSGTITFDDKPTSQLSVSGWTNVRRRQIALMWQELRLFPELTAEENVRIKNQLTHHQKKRTLKEWFDRLGIADKAQTPVRLMSYGQQQRVAFIRTLCQPSDFILLDEPVSHLDEDNAALMAELLCEEAKRTGAGVLVTSIGKQLPLSYDRLFSL